MGDARSDFELLDDVQSQAYAHGLAVAAPVGSRDYTTRTAEDSLRAYEQLLRRLRALRAAVRAADDIMTASSSDEIADAFTAYRAARARCGDVTP